MMLMQLKGKESGVSHIMKYLSKGLMIRNHT